MPQETHTMVREAQIGKGMIWRQEEVCPGGLEEGLQKYNGPKRQTEGSRRGRVWLPKQHKRRDLGW
jgi:hypothetical protein